MLERERQNRTFVGVGELQRLMLKLGRELVAQHTPVERAQQAVVIIEFRQDFPELRPTCTIGCRMTGEAQGNPGGIR